MKFIRIIISVAAFLSAFTASAQFRDGAYTEMYDSETVSSVKSHVRELSAAHLEGRKAGSDGEKAAAEYVAEVLENYGVEVLHHDNSFVNKNVL